MKRIQRLNDLFEVKCKACGSTAVDLSVDECGECGLNIEAECRECENCFKYHDFKEIEVKEIKRR